ncbi:transposase family protein, partial [Acidomonas methanolica]|uniref:transposase family protein n=1 Tax=Acidomonas methanolica TaxID=437 RepID=UPI00222FB60D
MSVDGILLAASAGAENPTNMINFWEKNQAFLWRLSRFFNGTPSHGGLSGVCACLDAQPCVALSRAARAAAAARRD